MLEVAIIFIHQVAARDCMKRPQVRANRLTIRRIMAAYTNASPLALERLTRVRLPGAISLQPAMNLRGFKVCGD